MADAAPDASRSARAAPTGTGGRVMRLFTIETERRVTRRTTVAAPDITTAERMARRHMLPGERLSRVCESAVLRPAETGQTALGHLLHQAYLPGPDFGDRTVRDWLVAARAAEPGAFEALSIAGLRVTGASLFVGSPSCIPTLGQWVRGTPWEGPSLLAALRALPGAAACNLTFSGRRARAVELPLAFALGEVVGHPSQTEASHATDLH